MIAVQINMTQHREQPERLYCIDPHWCTCLWLFHSKTKQTDLNLGYCCKIHKHCYQLLSVLLLDWNSIYSSFGPLTQCSDDTIKTNLPKSKWILTSLPWFVLLVSDHPFSVKNTLLIETASWPWLKTGKGSFGFWGGPGAKGYRVPMLATQFHNLYACDSIVVSASFDVDCA